MRLELLYRPRLLLERLAALSVDRRRLARLDGTVADGLQLGHIDSLELLDLVRPFEPTVVYDVGANVGTWARLARAVLPNAAIHAFEPLPQHVETLRRELGLLPDVSVHPVALGALQGSAVFHVISFSDASSFLPLTSIGAREWDFTEQRTETLPVTRLDDYVASECLPRPDLLKLDVQGFELEVLRGATQCLEHASALITEVSFAEFYKDQPLFADVVAFLSDHDFLPQAFASRTATGRIVRQADVLFLARRHVA